MPPALQEDDRLSLVSPVGEQNRLFSTASHALLIMTELYRV